MANAQVLVLIRAVVGTTISDDAVRGAVEAAARIQGFTPGAWSSNTAPSVPVVPDPAGFGVSAEAAAALARDGALSVVVANGPWGPTSTRPGFAFAVGGSGRDPRVPVSGVNMTFYAYRQNLLNGPSGWSSAAFDVVRTALAALPGVRAVTIGHRAPGTVIAWDRGIPAPIELTANSPTPASNGLFWGLLAVAGLAFAASRGSAAKGMLGKLSTNREGLTFEEWRRAAGVSPSTTGVHAAWIKGEDPSEWRLMQRATTVASRTRLMGVNPRIIGPYRVYMLYNNRDRIQEGTHFSKAAALKEAAKGKKQGLTMWVEYDGRRVS